ncbi:hypothetical protein TSOC_008726 [Tetrabaena socialis]|uniref:Fe2OG dioxygenase domain-containing protein n=1 Tax=Tetrabaena socialis TaxID=47790 RepID=A0A2J7ZXQ3_9CHLO|nr:hypothetical protein TSOC_008726 [Tetrabaena socialis]|eukprot:PNH05048.1 hypothetical protein TSOC_008726 [Tetrabaena socialis]
MAALVFKMGALVLKQLAKPLGSRFEKWALNHPVARRYIISAAQVVHSWEVYISRGAEGKAGRAFVGSMTEEKSVELASKIASEGFVFTGCVRVRMRPRLARSLSAATVAFVCLHEGKQSVSCRFGCTRTAWRAPPFGARPCRRRLFSLLRPGALCSFSAAKYCKSDHIAPHDDRAYTQVRLDSGRVITASRTLADWRDEYGGVLLDLEDAAAARDGRGRPYVPLWNSLVAFTVPRYHAVTPLATSRPRYSVFGWFLEPGKRYPLYRGKGEEEAQARARGTGAGSSQGGGGGVAATVTRAAAAGPGPADQAGGEAARGGGRRGRSGGVARSDSARAAAEQAAAGDGQVPQPDAAAQRQVQGARPPKGGARKRGADAVEAGAFLGRSAERGERAATGFRNGGVAHAAGGVGGAAAEAEGRHASAARPSDGGRPAVTQEGALGLGAAVAGGGAGGGGVQQHGAGRIRLPGRWQGRRKHVCV